MSWGPHVFDADGDNVKDEPMPHHLAGLSWTRSGYGNKIPSARVIYIEGKRRRIYTTIWSNIGTSWVTYKGKRCIVR